MNSVNIPNLRLSNGVEIPQVGMGLFAINSQEETASVVKTAISLGYRSFDTSSAYLNVEGLGNGIKNSGINRKDLFITTKAFIHEYGYEKTKKAFERALKKLQTDYIDLYLLHQPFGDYYSAWRALEDLYKDGKIRAIGVCNFYEGRFQDLMLSDDIHIKPMVNQVEIHPYYQREEEVKLFKESNTVVEAWGPLMKGNENLLKNETIKKIGEKYGKSIAQVILRWELQRGLVIIPKTVHKERMIENLEIFDFELSEEDMKEIKGLDGTLPRIFDYTTSKHANHVYNWSKKVEEFQKENP